MGRHNDKRSSLPRRPLVQVRNRHDYQRSDQITRRQRAEPECQICGQEKNHPDHG